MQSEHGSEKKILAPAKNQTPDIHAAASCFAD